MPSFSDILTGGNEATIHRPRPVVSFGGGAGAGGALGAAAGAAASLAGVGGEPSLSTLLISLEVRRCILPGADHASLRFARPAEPPPVGEAGSVGIDLGDGEVPLLAGSVELVERRGNGTVRVAMGNGGQVLARSRVNRSFADQAPGDVIAALAGDAGIDTDAGGSGARLPRYVADDRRPVIDHVAQLAAAAGRIAAFDAEGRLVLIDDAAAGDPVATLVRGESVLDVRLGRRTAHVGALTVIGAGAPESGGNAWAWLRKSNGPQKAELGDGAPQRLVHDAALRAQQAVSDRAGAAIRAGDRATGRTRILALGVPAAAPGRVVGLSGYDDADGNYFVTAVVHRFDTRHGYTTEIEASRIGEANPLLAALGGLGGLP